MELHWHADLGDRGCSPPPPRPPCWSERSLLWGAPDTLVLDTCACPRGSRLVSLQVTAGLKLGRNHLRVPPQPCLLPWEGLGPAPPGYHRLFPAWPIVCWSSAPLDALVSVGGWESLLVSPGTEQALGLTHWVIPCLSHPAEEVQKSQVGCWLDCILLLLCLGEACQGCLGPFAGALGSQARVSM